MKKSLTHALSPLEASTISEEYLGSPTLRKRLVELLNAKREQNYRQRLSVSSYESPSWALIQADGVGYERAILDAINLLSDGGTSQTD